MPKVTESVAPAGSWGRESRRTGLQIPGALPCATLVSASPKPSNRLVKLLAGRDDKSLDRVAASHLLNVENTSQKAPGACLPSEAECTCLVWYLALGKQPVNFRPAQ